MNSRNRTYRTGWLTVAWTVSISALLCLTLVGSRPGARAGSSGESLDRQPIPLGEFRLVERTGQEVTQADLADEVWIAGFIFTRCPTSCPRISAQMKGLQEKLDGTGVRLVSVSVDPERDTPEVLAEYARGFGADPDRWWFLTGPKDDVLSLILDQFHVPVAPTTEAERAQGAEEVAHSQKLALVDRGNRVVGYFDSNEPDAVGRLLKRARQIDHLWGSRLPSINAGLNATSGLLVLIGWWLILRGRWRAHAAVMLSAVAVSCLFLAGYLTYHFLVAEGNTPFQGVGKGLRSFYFTILLSHTILAAVVPVLVVLTLWRALRGQFDQHVRIARVTVPIWLYVSITGVMVYWMLYQVDYSGIVGTL